MAYYDNFPPYPEDEEWTDTDGEGGDPFEGPSHSGWPPAPRPEPAAPSPDDAPRTVATAVHQAVKGGYGRYGVEDVKLGHDDPGWRLAVAQALEHLLMRSVGVLWRNGWQPADLHRLARKKSKLTGHTVRDVMLAELSGYDRATVDSRYWDQLADLDAERWWPEQSGPLQAKVGKPEWLIIVETAVSGAAVLAKLSKVDQHWPPPGEGRARPANAASVDDRMLSRVQGLLAKAESTSFEAEAESFTAAAQALMARHSIDLALLAAQGSRTADDEPEALRIGLDQPYEQAKAMLLGVVADANNCRTVWSKQWSFCTVVGFPAELLAVQNLFTSLLIQAMAALQRIGSRTHSDGTSRTRSFRASFLMSYAGRIGERLRSATEAETQQAATEARAEGHDLLPILASRRQQTEDAFSAMFPQTTQMRTSTITDQEGWAAGRAAADLARLAAGEELDD